MWPARPWFPAPRLIRRSRASVGKTVAERALQVGIKKVVFDRGGYVYTGRVAEVAAGAREAGLDF